MSTDNSYSLITSTEAQDFTGIPEGLSFLLRFPQEHLFLLFADPDAILSRCSPQEYEAREPGCTAAWCRCMGQILEWIQHDPGDAPLISRQRYMQINALLTNGVQKMLNSHIPGTIRKGPVVYSSKDHTHKGIIQALLYKQRLEEEYEFCRGTRNASILVSPKSSIMPDSRFISNYNNLEGINIVFRPLRPDGSGPEKTASDDISFKCQLLALLEKEVITPLNKQLKALQDRKITKPRLLVKLIRIIAGYWPRLEQIHPPADGSCRTNYMLMQYIFMKFGFPPPVLRDPNAIDLVHTSLCKRIIGIGLKNSLALMDKMQQPSPTGVIIEQYTKRYLKKPACFFPRTRDYQKYLMPDALNFDDGYVAQMKQLTQEFIAQLDSLRTITQTGTRPLKTPLHGRKKSIINTQNN
ncbi:hypothetical protein [Endozoicomonas sp. SESOKO1]|uniref:hypothetical protein n=1 Tax=Endozoicomonas sp. SESOKO1 TaxID=2828742 RepID=UPI002149126F|nr:hypothetical protein [Endozoicomonas sp. SESOKO1]